MGTKGGSNSLAHNLFQCVSCPSIPCWVTFEHSVSPSLPVSGATPAIFSVSWLSSQNIWAGQAWAGAPHKAVYDLLQYGHADPSLLFWTGNTTLFCNLWIFLWWHKIPPPLAGFSNFRVCCWLTSPFNRVTGMSLTHKCTHTDTHAQTLTHTHTHTHTQSDQAHGTVTGQFLDVCEVGVAYLLWGSKHEQGKELSRLSSSEINPYFEDFHMFKN